MNYALFPVIAAAQALAIDFLQEIDLPNKLGQCTLHLHDTPYYLRPHCDVSELDCVVVIIHSPPTPIWATEVGCPAPPLFGRLQGCFEFCFGF
jgi:hypothetical protein